METGPLNFVTLSRRDFNNQRVKPDENLYFVHEQYVDDKGEVKTKIVLYKGKIPIGLVDKGRNGLSVFRTALSLGDETVVVDQSAIMTDGRALQVGDMFIDSSADNWLYQVTATPGTQAHAERIVPVRGEKGDKGDTGATPDLTMSAAVNDTVGLPSVRVYKGGTVAKPHFNLQFQNLKGEKGDTGDTGATPDITLYATADNSVGTPSVAVTKNGNPENPVFTLGFKNIKGDKGEKGDTGDVGPQGVPGPTPSITMTATANNVSGVPDVTVVKNGTAENPEFRFVFKNLKGAKGDKGDTGDTGPQGPKGDPGIADVRLICAGYCMYNTITNKWGITTQYGSCTVTTIDKNNCSLNFSYGDRDRNKVYPIVTGILENQVGISIVYEHGINVRVTPPEDNYTREFQFIILEI